MEKQPRQDGITPYVFIVRIWSELRDRQETPAELPVELPIELRGVIEEVPSGQRHYFRQIDEISTYIKANLASRGFTVESKQGIFQRLWHLLW